MTTRNFIAALFCLVRHTFSVHTGSIACTPLNFWIVPLNSRDGFALFEVTMVASLATSHALRRLA